MVKNGKMLRENMKQELITHEELTSQLRQQGIDNINLVKDVLLKVMEALALLRRMIQTKMR